MLLPSYNCPLGSKLGLQPTICRLCCYCPLPPGAEDQATAAPCHPSRVCATAASPPPASQSHCGETQRPRPWFHRPSVHAHTLDTRDAASASGPRTPAPLLLFASTPDHSQEGSHWLELPPMGKAEDPSNLHLQSSQKPLLPLLPIGPSQSWPQNIPAVCTYDDLSRQSCMETMLLCLPRMKDTVSHQASTLATTFR